MHKIDCSVPHFVTRVRGISIPFTLQLITDVLKVPRIEFPNYPSYECMRIVSKDKLMSTFSERPSVWGERPSVWGERQFTYCSAFAKSPQFLNMVMTFVLYPLLHYNSLTESHARFLLSLLKHLTIDFPSYFIVSLIDVFQDLASRDKLIFPSAITRILRHFFVPFPTSDPFTFMCAINATTVKHSEAQFRSRQQDSTPPSRLTPSRSTRPTSAPSSVYGYSLRYTLHRVVSGECSYWPHS